MTRPLDRPLSDQMEKALIQFVDKARDEPIEEIDQVWMVPGRGNNGEWEDGEWYDIVAGERPGAILYWRWSE